MKINISDEFHIIVSEMSFDLYRKTPKSKRHNVVGYYTNLANVAKKITMLNLANKEIEVSLVEFIKEWREMEQKTLGTLKEYAVD